MRTLTPVKAEICLLPLEGAVPLALATFLVLAAFVQPGSDGLHFKFESLVMFMLGMPLLMHATAWGTPPVKLPLIESQRTVSFLCVHVYPALATTVQS